MAYHRKGWNVRGNNLICDDTKERQMAAGSKLKEIEVAMWRLLADTGTDLHNILLNG